MYNLNEVINDVTTFRNYTLTEGSDKTGRKFRIVRGIFQEVDTPNQNGRIYPRSLWERIINSENTKRAIKNRESFGELDHPEDGKTELKRVSHIITDLKLEGNHVIGEAEILPTPHGKILEALFTAGTGVGISSRGSGSVNDSSGSAIVQDDYKYESFDFVSGPSVSTAFPKPVYESGVNKLNGGIVMTIADLQVIEEEVTLLGKSLPSLSELDKAKVVKKLTDSEITINKIINSDSTLSDYGSRIKKYIDTIRTGTTVTDVTYKDRLAAAIAIIEAIKTKYLKFRESVANDIAKSNDELEKKYDMSCRVSDEIVKKYKTLQADNHDLEQFKKKHDYACKISEELLSRCRVFKKTIADNKRTTDIMTSLIEELTKVGKDYKDKYEVLLKESTKSKIPIKSVTEDRYKHINQNNGDLPVPKSPVLVITESQRLLKGLLARLPVGSK